MDRRGFRNPQREVTEPSDTLAYWWDLQKWHSREVTLELTIRGNEERNQIAWRGLSQSLRHPQPPQRAEMG